MKKTIETRTITTPVEYEPGRFCNTRMEMARVEGGSWKKSWVPAECLVIGEAIGIILKGMDSFRTTATKTIFGTLTPANAMALEGMGSGLNALRSKQSALHRTYAHVILELEMAEDSFSHLTTRPDLGMGDHISIYAQDPSSPTGVRNVGGVDRTPQVEKFLAKGNQAPATGPTRGEIASRR